VIINEVGDGLKFGSKGTGGSGATLDRAKNEEVFMAALKGLVVPAGDGQHVKDSSGQVTTMKLFGRETGQSVTMSRRKPIPVRSY